MSHPSDRIRNIALVGHGLSGKTSLAEAMLFLSGATSRLGKAGSPSSVLDFEPEEHKRGGSVGTSFAWLEHRDHKINVIDTPGDGNFVFDAFTAMRGADACAVVVSTPDGIEVQTERAFHHAGNLGLPRVIVLNKMDRERADPEDVLLEIEESLGVKALPLQVPIGSEAEFTGVVSLIQDKALTYVPDGSGTFTSGPVPAELRDAVDAAWESLVEQVAETDEELLEIYLDTFELSQDQVRKGLRDAIRSGDVVPVLYTAAANNVAVHGLMDLITWALPSPVERGPVEGLQGDEDVEIEVGGQVFLAQIIKTFMDEFSGKISIFRVLSGTTPSDGQILNTTSGQPERLGSVYALRGKERVGVLQGVAGDILGVAKLKASATNDTLSALGETRTVARQVYPQPMMSYAVTPAGRGDEDKVRVAIDRLIDEDPTLSRGYDALSHKMTLSGMGQAHLDLSVAKLARKFKVVVETALPAVPYRETLRRPVRHAEGKHKKQTGGAGQFGVCYLDVEPMPRNGGFEFVDKIYGGTIPRQLIPAVEKGVRDRMSKGHLAGYPLVDLRVTLTDGKYHPVDSKEVAFQAAGSKALASALSKGGVKLLEPIYALEIVVPNASMGDIMGDVTGRRGRIMGMDQKGRKSIINAAVPLSEIQRYAPDLRSMTGGRGTFTMSFLGYEDVPGNLQEGVVQASPYRRAADD
jgi:elongation factor G